VKSPNFLLDQIGTTIFTVMSALAVQHGAINLGQGFPDTDGPDDIIMAAADALKDGRNQYPPLTGVPELRAAVAAANRRILRHRGRSRIGGRGDVGGDRGDHGLPDGAAQSRRRGRADRAAL
jgi:Aspartate/tyrosine/aromatic aminotransferase